MCSVSLARVGTCADGVTQMQSLNTSDYRGMNWPSQQDDDEDEYPLYVPRPIRSCSDFG